MYRKFVLAAVAVAAFATAAFAQGQGAGTEWTPPDPAAMIAMRVNRLATILNLTDAQKTQATAIFTNAHTAAQSLRTNMQTDRQSLAAAIKKNDTATIDSVSASIGSLMGQLTAIEAKADAAFYAILTPDQQAKFDAMPRGGFRGVPGGGMGPGMGPGMGGGMGPDGMGRRGPRQ